MNEGFTTSDRAPNLLPELSFSLSALFSLKSFQGESASTATANAKMNTPAIR